MKPLLFAVFLALALPAYAQVPTCNHKPIFLPVQPTPGGYSCAEKDGTAWTLAYSPAYNGSLVVTSSGPAGTFTWEQNVVWDEPVTYQACTQSQCWKFTQHLMYAGGNGLDFKGRFVVE